MLLAEVLQYVLNAAGSTTVVGASCADNDLICFGSNFTAIGAAFTTQGYFTQHDIIHWILYDKAGRIGLWAPLLYIFAAFGGLVGVATGMAPKNYMWFFLGPAFYHWLIATPAQVNASEWRVGNVPQDQREVWRLAEVGLINSRLVQRMAKSTDGAPYVITNDSAPTGGPYGDGTVQVALFFAWYDSLISEVTQFLIEWTGTYNLKADVSASTAKNTNVVAPPPGSVYVDGPSGIKSNETAWILLSQLKWTLLEDITTVQIQTADLRDAFITFLSSNCGDRMAEYIDISKFAAARNARGNNLPDTVFIPWDMALGGTDSYTAMAQWLEGHEVPVPASLKKFLSKRITADGAGGAPALAGKVDETSFRNFFPMGNGIIYDGAIINSQIRCDLFFEIVMNGMRWEAGHAFHKLVNSKRGSISPEGIMYALFYGWGIRKPGTSGGVGGESDPGDSLNENEMELFLQDMILAYLVRNELRIAPPTLYNPRYSNSDKVEEYVQTNQRTVGEKSKYGELYAWATLIPYMQGVLLYILCIGYPFACILVVVPGWHKTIFTWMSFWAWAKLWDVGFAVVGMMERSIWAMMGSKTETKVVSSMIAEMQSSNFGCLMVSCPPTGTGGNYGTPYTHVGFDCPVPLVQDGPCGFAGGGSFTPIENLLHIFDRTLVLGNALDLDLANAYYIYVMAALYMAVPAITGQLVLGAKSGVSAMVGAAIGGVASEAGRAAGAGFSSDMTQKAKGNAAALGQTAYFKGLSAEASTNEALASKAGQIANSAQGAFLGGAKEGYDAMADILKSKYAALGTGLGAAKEMQKGLFALGKDGAELAGQFGYDENKLRGFLAGNGIGTSAFKKGVAGDQKAKAQTSAATQSAQAALGDATKNYNDAVADAAKHPGDTKKEAARDKAETALQSAGKTMEALGGGTGGGGGGGKGGGPWGSKVAAGAGMLEDMAGLYAQAANFGINQKSNYEQAKALASKGGSAVTAASLNAQATGLGQGFQALQAQAHFGAENSAWAARNEFAQAVSGDLGAMGVSAGVVDPGPKPVNFDGAAMSGMLGSKAQDLAHYADNENSTYWGASAEAKAGGAEAYDLSGGRRDASGHAIAAAPYYQTTAGMAANVASQVGPTALMDEARGVPYTIQGALAESVAAAGAVLHLSDPAGSGNQMKHEPLDAIAGKFLNNGSQEGGLETVNTIHDKNTKTKDHFLKMGQ